MPKFKIVNSIKAAPPTNAEKFNSAWCLVDRHGKRVESSYLGRKYQIVSKVERDYTKYERVYRVLIGVAAALLSLGLLYQKVYQLFTKKKETIRYAVDAAHWSERELQLEIPEEVKEGIAALIEGKGEKKAGVKSYQYPFSRRQVFTLDHFPGLIFKTTLYPRFKFFSAPIDKRVAAQTVVRAEMLSKLYIPRRKLITVGVKHMEYDIVAEEKLEIPPQTGPYQEEANSQLARFILLTGYKEATRRNCPVLADGRIALLDIKEIFK